MSTLHFTIAITLVLTGALFWLACSILLRVRAFKESVGWGITCLLLPLGLLFFVVRFWDENKQLFMAQMVAFAVAIVGASQIVSVSEIREFLEDTWEQNYVVQEMTNGRREQLKKRDLERMMTLKAEAQERTRALYGYVQNWQLELQAKRPGLNASAAEVEAFNREHANYTGLLAEYKEAVKALAEPAPAR